MNQDVSRVPGPLVPHLPVVPLFIIDGKGPTVSVRGDPTVIVYLTRLVFSPSQGDGCRSG